MISTAIPALGEVRRVVDPDEFGRYSAHSGNGRRCDAAGPRQRTEVLVRQEQHPPHGGRGHPHPAQVRAAVRELAVRAVGLAPLLEQRQDLGAPRSEQPVHRRPARRLSASSPRPRGGRSTGAPGPGRQVQDPAGPRAASSRARRRRRAARAAPPWWPRRPGAGRRPLSPNRPFPSTRISFTAISLTASDNRAISALAASSSSRAPSRDARLGRRQRGQRALLGDRAGSA